MATGPNTPAARATRHGRTPPKDNHSHRVGQSTSGFPGRGRFRSRNPCDLYVRAVVARRATHVGALPLRFVAVFQEARRWLRTPGCHSGLCL